MTRRLLIFLLLLLPSGGLRAQSNEHEIVDAARQSCRDVDEGEFAMSGDAMTRVDLNGDGQADVLVDEAKFACSTSASLFSPTGGSRLHAIVGERHDVWMVHAWRLVEWGEHTILLLAEHGSQCGGFGYQPCFEAVTWSDDGPRTVRGGRDPVQEAAVPAAPEDGGPRAWEVATTGDALILRERPSTSAAILASYAPAEILSNLGCQRAEGRAWCDVQAIGGGSRGFVAAEFLRPAVSPDGTAPMGPDDSALRAGQGDFDATGSIPCAMSVGQPSALCEFGVSRAGGGYATVVVKRPGGGTRAIFFQLGRPLGADTSEADWGEFSATREGDLNLVRIGEERYEIPDAVVLGG